MESCTKCKLRVHPRCQINWEEINNYDDDTCVGVFCYSHHPYKVTQFAAECRKASETMIAERSSCDWMVGKSNVCEHYSLPTKVCGADGCEKPVHHLCQINWETTNNVPELGGGKLRCREHHPDFNLFVGADGKQQPVSAPIPSLPPLQASVETTSRSPINRLRSFLAGSRLHATLTGGAGGSSMFQLGPAQSGNAGGERPQQEEPPAIGTSSREQQADIIVGLAAAAHSTAVSTASPIDVDNINAFLDLVPNPHFDEEEEVDNSFWDDIRECGNGDDSDEEGVVSLLHNDAVHTKIMLSTSGKIIDDDEDCIDEEGVVFESTVAAEVLESTMMHSSSLLNAPNGWQPPCPPESWTGYTTNDKRHDAPDEEDIDNPGNWHLFSFRPKYSSDKKYIGHFTPAGAQVLRSNAAGQRIIDDWNFFYNGWTGSTFDKGTYVRGEATRENLKPSSRQGCLDVDVLRKHGLTADRVANDPLWFFQMLFPFCQPSSSTITDDNRMPFFTQVAWYTHIYAAEKGASLGFGHKWVPPDVADLVRWVGIPIRHGSLDGKPGTLSCRFKKTDPRYDECIANVMTLSRFLQLKRYMKLNNNSVEKPRTSPDYDPCNKYDMIFKVLCHNMNYCTLKADLDLAVDESTWGFAGYCGEAGWRLMNKPVGKGE